MKKKQLVKSDKPKESIVKPLCGTYNAPSCTNNNGTGGEIDILL